MTIVQRRYTCPPDDQQQRSIRYIQWMRAERAKLNRRTDASQVGRQAMPEMRVPQDT